MDLVLKDMQLFCNIAERAGIELELSPVMLKVFADAMQRYGRREWSPNVIRRLEERSGTRIQAPGFPSEIVDDEPDSEGQEVKPRRPSVR